MPKLPRATWLLPALLALTGCARTVVLDPTCDVARQQGDLIVVATVLMLIVIVPVIALTLFFAWRYRASNRTAKYTPDWDHSTQLELVIWAVPLLIIIALGAITWISTHTLDPYRPLDRLSKGRPVPAGVAPLEVQVVSLDWKWLFIYPKEGVATVNELALPVDRPVRFLLTSSSVMNAFYIPELAGMIYTMPGMQTELNAVANQPGTFRGLSSHYSGKGFSGMTFKFHGLAQQDFDQWVAAARAQGKALDRKTYLQLAQPSERDPVQRFASVEEGLYDKVLNRCAEDGKMCMHHMMAIDENGGDAYVRAMGLNLPQDVCTSKNAAQVVASLEARHASARGAHSVQ